MIGGLDDWMGRLLRGAIICGVVGMLVAIGIHATRMTKTVINELDIYYDYLDTQKAKQEELTEDVIAQTDDLPTVLANMGSRTGLDENLEDEDDSEDKDISERILRFHVKANSDSEEDVALKLLVRDKVLKMLQIKLQGCKNVEAAKQIISDNMDEIRDTAMEVVAKEGYDYQINVYLGTDYFPIRQYGELVIPELISVRQQGRTSGAFFIHLPAIRWMPELFHQEKMVRLSGRSYQMRIMTDSL